MRGALEELFQKVDSSDAAKVRVAGVQGLNGEYILLVDKAVDGAVAMKPGGQAIEGEIGKDADMKDQEVVICCYVM